MSTDALERTFWGCYISALRGCWALKFLHALQIDQALLAHTWTGRGVPQYFNRENLKFGLKFSMLGSITSGLLGVSPRNFFQSTCRESGVINWVQFLEGLPPKFRRAKNCPKFCAISDNFRFWSRISPERIHISKIGKPVYQLPPLSRWVKKVVVLWSINKKVIEPNVYIP